MCQPQQMAFADAAMASAASDVGGGAYWNTASGMFGGQLDPEPEPQPSELAGELRALLAERGHDTDMADELCTISGWHNLSGQRLWEQSTTRHYSDAQKKLLLEQAAGAGDSIALVAPSGLPQGMPAEIVRAIAASESESVNSCPVSSTTVTFSLIKYGILDETKCTMA